MSPSERSLKAKLAAHRLHAQVDPHQITAAARKAALDRFEREVDPDGKLPVEERQRRAAHARKAYFAGLALKSARARRVAREGAQAEAELIDAAVVDPDAEAALNAVDGAA